MSERKNLRKVRMSGRKNDRMKEHQEGTMAARKNNGLNRKEHIYSLIRYIEENLFCSIDTKLLSKLGFVSHMQLYRDFYSITGHSVKEYVRKRRLSNALALIRHSEMNLADIAYECGYTSQQIFSTSVKNAVGLTPLEYRASGEVYYFPPFCLNWERQVTIAAEPLPPMLGIKYYHNRLQGIENAALKDFFSLVPDFPGRIFGRDGVQSGPRFCYELYITNWEEFYDTLKDSHFVIVGQIPEVLSNFATTIVQNQEEEIRSGWDYLYTKWLGISMFEYGDEPYYEEYLVKNRQIKKLRLLLPVRKKSDYSRITFERPGSMKFIVSTALGDNAERVSAEQIVDCLKEQYPYLIKTSNQFYVCKSDESFTNGVRIAEELELDDNKRRYLLNKPDCLYAVLSCGLCSDYSLYREVLQNWVKDNGFKMLRNNMDGNQTSIHEPIREPIFALVDTKLGYESLRMKLYCPVKMV